MSPKDWVLPRSPATSDDSFRVIGCRPFRIGCTRTSCGQNEGSLLIFVLRSPSNQYYWYCSTAKWVALRTYLWTILSLRPLLAFSLWFINLNRHLCLPLGFYQQGWHVNFQLREPAQSSFVRFCFGSWSGIGRYTAEGCRIRLHVGVSGRDGRGQWIFGSRLHLRKVP